MDYDKNICPIINVDGVIENGKQFDIDITLPEDNRNVIYGIVRDCYKDPVPNAVVKLIEVICNHHGKEERKPVSHTFTDCDGEFVFGPLCHNRMYEIQIWVDNVKHVKVCAKAEEKDKECLKGTNIDCPKECPKELTPVCCDKCDKCDKFDKCDKWDDFDKCNKCDKWDKCDKCEKKCDKKCDKKDEY